MNIYQHKAIRAVTALAATATIGLAPVAVAQESTAAGNSTSQDLVNINRDIRISYDPIDVIQGQSATEDPSAVDSSVASNPDVTFSTTDNTAWFSINANTGQITVNPGTDVPPDVYDFLVTVNYGSSLTRTGNEYTQNLRTRVTVHTGDSSTDTSATTTPAPGVNVDSNGTVTFSAPNLRNLINQGGENLQAAIEEIQRQTAAAQGEAAEALQNLVTLLQTAQNNATEQVLAEIDRLEAAVNAAANRATTAAQNAADNARNRVDAVQSRANAAATNAQNAIDRVVAPNEPVQSKTPSAPETTVTPEQIAEFQRLLAERTRTFLEASGITLTTDDDGISIVISNVVNVSALADDPAAFYTQLNDAVQQALAALQGNSAVDPATALSDAVDEITKLVDGATAQLNEAAPAAAAATGATDSVLSKTAAADSQGSADTKTANTANSRKTLANTGPEFFGLTLAAITLAGVGLLLVKRGARA